MIHYLSRELWPWAYHCWCDDWKVWERRGGGDSIWCNSLILALTTASSIFVFYGVSFSNLLVTWLRWMLLKFPICMPWRFSYLTCLSQRHWSRYFVVVIFTGVVAIVFVVDVVIVALVFVVFLSLALGQRQRVSG